MTLSGTPRPAQSAFTQKCSQDLRPSHFSGIARGASCIRSCWVCKGGVGTLVPALGHSSGVWSSQDRGDSERALPAICSITCSADIMAPSCQPGRGRPDLLPCGTGRRVRGAACKPWRHRCYLIPSAPSRLVGMARCARRWTDQLKGHDPFVAEFRVELLCTSSAITRRCFRLILPSSVASLS
jgi:hypothetical protein